MHLTSSSTVRQQTPLPPPSLLPSSHFQAVSASQGPCATHQNRWWWQTGLTFVSVFFYLFIYLYIQKLNNCMNERVNEWIVHSGWIDSTSSYFFSFMSLTITSSHQRRENWLAGVFWSRSCPFFFFFFFPPPPPFLDHKSVHPHNSFPPLSTHVGRFFWAIRPICCAGSGPSLERRGEGFGGNTIPSSFSSPLLSILPFTDQHMCRRWGGGGGGECRGCTYVCVCVCLCVCLCVCVRVWWGAEPIRAAPGTFPPSSCLCLVCSGSPPTPSVVSAAV